jgi:SAM-dependent methyltransferase
MEHLLRATARAEARHFWFRGFRFFVTPLLRQITKGLRDPLLLDCGCGTGNNLELLGRFGHAYGFDLTLLGLQIGREHGRRRLVRASVTAAPFPNDSFDVVTSFDVLYSLTEVDERAAAAEMQRLVKPGGFVLVNVAAMESLRGGHSVLGREVRRYSRRSLVKLMTDAGFTVERITHTNAVLYPAMALVRAVQRRRGLAAEEEADHDLRVPPAPLNLAMTAALGIESLWLRIGDSPFGSSLLCLAKKPV